jgi:hypothetical protein
MDRLRNRTYRWGRSGVHAGVIGGIEEVKLTTSDDTHRGVPGLLGRAAR